MKEETDVRQPPQGKRFVTVHTQGIVSRANNSQAPHLQMPKGGGL